jgi:hypothetical protein
VEREKEESGEREGGEWRERSRRVEREKEESGEMRSKKHNAVNGWGHNQTKIYR